MILLPTTRPVEVIQRQKDPPFYIIKVFSYSSTSAPPHTSPKTPSLCMKLICRVVRYKKNCVLIITAAGHRTITMIFKEFTHKHLIWKCQNATILFGYKLSQDQILKKKLNLIKPCSKCFNLPHYSSLHCRINN